jgi:hypothetical protein
MRSCFFYGGLNGLRSWRNFRSLLFVFITLKSVKLTLQVFWFPERLGSIRSGGSGGGCRSGRSLDSGFFLFLLGLFRSHGFGQIVFLLEVLDPRVVENLYQGESL